MRDQFRFVAGIVSLVAMTLSLAEGVRASVCLPGTFATVNLMATGEAGVDHEDCMSAGGEGPSSNSESGPADSHRNCPLSPLGIMGSCTAAASLPTAVLSQSASPAPEHSFAFSTPEAAHPRLSATDLFHPPKS